MKRVSDKSGLHQLHQLPVTDLAGIGPAIAAKLARLGIATLQDILFYLPFRYQDRTRLVPLRSAHPGKEIVVEGTVIRTDIVMSRRRSLKCVIQDETSELSLRFFHFNAAQKNTLSPGTRIRCFGEARHGATGLEMYHPEYSLLNTGSHAPLEKNLTPVYPHHRGY